ncbi:MAG: molecular chaperone TorD family protein [Vibrio sp.]|uniref:molecular chaperone TorD family protein n=1 Tax=Vibrio sp. TaxID=678 RepID=UPI003A84B910
MIIHKIKILGSLFYQKYSQAESIELVEALVAENVLQASTLDELKSLSSEQLEQDFSALFEGIGFMPVPPWGSVYLDKEQVLFGESNVQYCLFLKQHGIVLNSGQREPEDQFGLMLLACAYLLEQDKTHAAYELLGQHLMPWGLTYLDQLTQKAPNVFYQQLASDVSLWLKELVEEFGIEVVEKKVYLR